MLILCALSDCSVELARYDNVEDELFLRYYEIDPVEVLQRAFEKSLVECKSEVSSKRGVEHHRASADFIRARRV